MIYCKYLEELAFLLKGGAQMLIHAEEKGQGLVEYAIILVLVAVVVIAVLMIMGPTIGNTFSKVSNTLP